MSSSSPPFPLHAPHAPVLITGGCGFVGCNIAKELAKSRSVVVLDNLVRANVAENAAWLRKQAGDNVEIVVGDVRDTALVNDLVSEASAVLHLAAQVAVTTSVANPIHDFEVNARGTLNVLEAVRRLNKSAPVIFASTNKVYGRLTDASHVRRVKDRYVLTDEQRAKGISEDTPLDFYSPYGCSKGVADQYVHDYSRIYGLRSVVLRMSCIYGPRQFGNEDQGWIAHFLLRALSGEDITIYGDGLQVRDALFVDDAVAAWLTALDRIDDVAGSTFNLGGGSENSLSLLELAHMICTIQGREPELRFAEWRPGDQLWYVSDVSRISNALNWRPTTGLLTGVRSLENWLESRFGTSPVSAELQEVHA